MPLRKIEFDREDEIDSWVENNIDSLLPGTNFISRFRIITFGGKPCVPDGFAYNLEERQWFVIENELIEHGVWKHIAEQVTRYVVALQSPENRKKMRDKILEDLREKDLIDNACTIFGVEPVDLYKELEIFVETIEPSVLMVIDDTNEDLIEFANALKAKMNIYRLHKFDTGSGTPEYFCPDNNLPAVETENTEINPGGYNQYDVLNVLGSGELYHSNRRFKCFKLDDGTIVYHKKSKYYPDAAQDYWYSISTFALNNCRENNVSHIILQMADDGFVKIPIAIVEEFFLTTRTSLYPDGSIKHYHIYITSAENPILFNSNNTPSFPLSEYSYGF